MPKHVVPRGGRKRPNKLACVEHWAWVEPDMRTKRTNGGAASDGWLHTTTTKET